MIAFDSFWLHLTPYDNFWQLPPQMKANDSFRHPSCLSSSQELRSACLYFFFINKPKSCTCIKKNFQKGITPTHFHCCLFLLKLKLICLSWLECTAPLHCSGSWLQFIFYSITSSYLTPHDQLIETTYTHLHHNIGHGERCTTDYTEDFTSLRRMKDPAHKSQH